MQVRVRFAPSPTGFFHIGSARTALFNWLYARHTGGVFVLRIEDTDKERNTEEALQVIYDSMRWLGLNWDEGPDAGGDFGPYLQSQRGDIYKKYVDQLLNAGRAYEKDGAIWLRLDGERYTEYDDFAKAEVEKVKAPPVVIDDVIRGRVERAEDRDFVIVRANGEPVFHLTNVVDDITMGITHVIRGEDHLSNTSKHILLYRALGAPTPVFAHMPLILKDPSLGKGKMSKRDRGALIEEYQQRHFIPAAVRNFLCLLGWSPKDDREVMDIDEVIERFELTDIQKGSARFDEKKMLHINAEYLRKMPMETFAWEARPILAGAGLPVENVDEDYLQSALRLCQEKIFGFEDLPTFSAFFFKDDFEFDEKALEKMLRKGDPDARLKEAQAALQAVEPWTEESIQEAFEALAESQQQKPFTWYPVVRMAVSGASGGPDLIPMLAVMGKERVIRRFDAFQNRL